MRKPKVRLFMLNNFELIGILILFFVIISLIAFGLAWAIGEVGADAAIRCGKIALLIAFTRLFFQLVIFR
jgi:hypothetical protein